MVGSNNKEQGEHLPVLRINGLRAIRGKTDST